MSNQVYLTNFYSFVAIDSAELDQVQATLETWGKELETSGLIILAPEGLNGTVSGTKAAVMEYEGRLQQRFPGATWPFKRAWSDRAPFPRFKVKQRPEIVTTGLSESPSIDLAGETFLTPHEWHKTLSEEDVIVIDTRNWYETDLGKFKGAIDPRFDTFQQFPEFVKNCGLPKDKKVLMYCTGGIRCEKASTIMRQEGYEDVYQLQGGILKYLEQYPEGHYEGECFVFDRRVAVDNKLQPSKKYSLCPHYGQPAEVEIVCQNCGKPSRVMNRCLQEPYKETCSKDCAYRLAQKEKRAERMKAKQEA